MSEERIYKKGTVVRLCCETNDPHSHEYNHVVLKKDATESELKQMAENFMWDTKEPSWWFEVDDEQ
jgi:hypothetical protein